MIAVWWMGLSAVDEEALHRVRAHLCGLFERPVQTALRGGCPQDAFDAARQQWSSSRLLAWVSQQPAPQADKVLGVFDGDLFIPVLSWVFGEAQLGGRCAVVSTARLHVPAAETGGWRALLSRGKDPREVFLVRLVKECAHELGHTFGLVHCHDAACLMSRSSTLLHVDAKSAALCSRCRRKLLRPHLAGSGAPS